MFQNIFREVKTKRVFFWITIIFIAAVQTAYAGMFVEGRIELSFKPDPQEIVSVSIEIRDYQAGDWIPGADFLFNPESETWYQDYYALFEDYVLINPGDEAYFQMVVFDVEVNKNRLVEQDEIDNQLILEDFVDYQGFLPAFKMNGYSETRIGDSFLSPVRVKTENSDYQSRFLGEKHFFFEVRYNSSQLAPMNVAEGEDVWGTVWFVPQEGLLSIDGNFFRPQEGQEIVSIEWLVKDTADPGEVTYIILDQIDLADPCDISQRTPWINPPLNEFALRVLPADEPVHELKIATYAHARRAGEIVPIYFLGQHLEDGSPSQDPIGYLYFDLDLIYNHSLLEPLYAIGKGGRKVEIEPTPDGTLRIAGDVESFGMQGLVFILFCRALQPGKTTLSLGSFSEVDSLDTPLEPFPIFEPGWIRIFPQLKPKD